MCKHLRTPVFRQACMGRCDMRLDMCEDVRVDRHAAMYLSRRHVCGPVYRYVCRYLQACLRACVQAYVQVHVEVCVQTCAQVYMHACMRVHAQAHAQFCPHANS